jgi:hypothetical protein
MKPFLPKYYFIILLMCCSFHARTQDIHFSQMFETPLLRNPALAGFSRVTSVCRPCTGPNGTA